MAQQDDSVQTFRGHTSGVCSLAKLSWKRSDDTFVSGSRGGKLKLWQVEKEKARRTFHGHPRSVLCVAKLTDNTFVSASWHELRLWQVGNNDALQIFSGHTDGVYSVAKLTDNTFVSGSGDRTLKLWNTSQTLSSRDYRVVFTLPFFRQVFPDEMLEEIYKYIALQQQAVLTLEGHTNRVNCVAKLTENTFVSGSDDNTLKLWVV